MRRRCGLRLAGALLALMAGAGSGAAWGQEVDCADPAMQGEGVRRLAVAVPDAVERGALGREGLLALRVALTEANAGEGLGPYCAAVEAVRRGFVPPTGAQEAVPADPRRAAARCDDPAAAGTLWNDMLPDIDAARGDGTLPEREYAAYAVAFTAVYARVSGMEAAPLPEVCRAFLGLWLIWRP